MIITTKQSFVSDECHDFVVISKRMYRLAKDLGIKGKIIVAYDATDNSIANAAYNDNHHESIIADLRKSIDLLDNALMFFLNLS